MNYYIGIVYCETQYLPPYPILIMAKDFEDAERIAKREYPTESGYRCEVQVTLQ